MNIRERSEMMQYTQMSVLSSGRAEFGRGKLWPVRI